VCSLCSAPVINGDEDGLEQDNMYEKVPDSFRQKISSLPSQVEAPKLPPMHGRLRKPSDDPAIIQNRASSATLPSALPPSSPQMRSRLQSFPSIKTPPPPSFPAPAAPPPSFPAPNPPAEYDDDDNDDELYARPDTKALSSPRLQNRNWIKESRQRSVTLPVKASLSYGGPNSAPLCPLPELPKETTSKQLESQEEEPEEPGYDRTKRDTTNRNYDHLKLGKL